MFISFEGVDGCGKTTQLNLLAEYLTAAGKTVLKIREPGGTPVSEKIRSLLLDSKNEMSDVCELLLFEAARAELSQKVIAPALAAGKIVLCDRFFDSTTAYQGYGRGFSIEFVKKLNEFAAGGLAPDLTFFIDTDIETAKKRTSNAKKDRMESAGDDFFRRVEGGFRKLADEKPEFYLIDGNQNIEKTREAIKNKILRAL